MTWTDDRIETLKRYWQDGFSASQIAQKLGGVTRNAVIGKVHRLGLSGRATTSRRAISTRTRAQASRRLARRRPKGRGFRYARSPIRLAPERPPILPELGPAPPSPVTLQSLTTLSCRWPEGDPKAPDFHFCGRIKCRVDTPYCDHYAAISFR